MFDENTVLKVFKVLSLCSFLNKNNIYFYQTQNMYYQSECISRFLFHFYCSNYYHSFIFLSTMGWFEFSKKKTYFNITVIFGCLQRHNVMLFHTASFDSRLRHSWIWCDICSLQCNCCCRIMQLDYVVLIFSAIPQKAQYCFWIYYDMHYYRIFPNSANFYRKMINFIISNCYETLVCCTNC